MSAVSMGEETANDSVVAHYIGAGSFVIGLPTRDLTQEDYQALSPELQMAAINCGLYQWIPERAAIGGADQVVAAPSSSKE